MPIHVQEHVCMGTHACGGQKTLSVLFLRYIPTLFRDMVTHWAALSK